ncbi:DNA-binding response regulator [Amycolatopsis thailandensis]|uniref:DNA-binding response regulator n=1 Tax=Amycolatopsis thailandensis TaxID=589330 RepID=A0A229SB28_9PSEU|nr:response regulator transcription factor [Amycolatopsis thailandensis]OXM56108.1 DNA-binding response regulator [Amycolatopsis thailandensis]
MARLLVNAPEIQRINSAITAAELLVKFRLSPADMVLLSVRTRPDVLADTIRTLTSIRPATRIILFGAPEFTPLAIKAIGEGAAGFLACEASSTTRTSESAAMPHPRTTSETGADLSRREMEVLRGISMGKTNGEIGSDLDLAEDTIKTHAQRLFRKLSATDRAHAVVQGMRRKLID